MSKDDDRVMECLKAFAEASVDYGNGVIDTKTFERGMAKVWMSDDVRFECNYTPSWEKLRPLFRDRNGFEDVMARYEFESQCKRLLEGTEGKIKNVSSVSSHPEGKLVSYTQVESAAYFHGPKVTFDMDTELVVNRYGKIIKIIVSIDSNILEALYSKEKMEGVCPPKAEKTGKARRPVVVEDVSGSDEEEGYGEESKEDDAGDDKFDETDMMEIVRLFGQTVADFENGLIDSETLVERLAAYLSHDVRFECDYVPSWEKLRPFFQNRRGLEGLKERYDYDSMLDKATTGRIRFKGSDRDNLIRYSQTEKASFFDGPTIDLDTSTHLAFQNRKISKIRLRVDPSPIEAAYSKDVMEQ